MSRFDQFNSPDTILSVCSYPDPEKGIKELNAVAWHSERTLKPLAHDKRRVVVIAEDIGGKAAYADGKYMYIERVWQKGNPLSLFDMLKAVLRYDKVKSVLFQFEFNIFGGVWPVLVLPFILLVIKLSGKRINFELHQVVLDIKQLANHVNIKNPLFQFVFNLGLHWFYVMVGLLSDEIIVLEEDLRKRLKHIVNDAKIVFVPIAIEQQKTITKRKARRLLDLKEEDFIVLVFGFVNWYKGSDWIVNAVRSSHQRHVRLLMAGGENPTLKDKDYYKKFFGKISEAARNSQKILLTGFVPDNKIAAYFSAADVVVLPYRVFMSASGPFSFALSFRKPILLSNKLYDYTKSEDFSDSMELSQLERKEMFFPFNKYVFNDLIRHMRAHDEYEAKLKEFSRTLGEKRSTEQMVKRLEQILVPNEMIAGEIALKYS